MSEQTDPTQPPPAPGGRRRLDRVLAEDFLAGLAGRPLDELRQRRRDAEQEEVDLSYLRRLVQGRLDIVRAELARRAGTGQGIRPEGDLVERLPEILGEGPPRRTHGSGRFLTVEPSRPDQRRRRVERVAGETGETSVSARSEEELRDALSRLEALEEEVSRDRRQVQQVMDACTAELTRRYKEGAARVDDLLPEA